MTKETSECDIRLRNKNNLPMFLELWLLFVLYLFVHIAISYRDGIPTKNQGRASAALEAKSSRLRLDMSQKSTLRVI